MNQVIQKERDGADCVIEDFLNGPPLLNVQSQRFHIGGFQVSAPILIRKLLNHVLFCTALTAEGTICVLL